MKYRVVILPVAQSAIDAHIKHIAIEKREPLSAAKVLFRIQHSIAELDEFPEAAPMAPESRLRNYEIRMRLVDRCRILFNVDKNSKTVRIVWFDVGGRDSSVDDLPTRLDKKS